MTNRLCKDCGAVMKILLSNYYCPYDCDKKPKKTSSDPSSDREYEFALGISNEGKGWNISISTDGKVKITGIDTVDEASKIFWDKVRQLSGR